jgi:D-alanyl-D-alanine carboxypeptidase
MHCVGSKARYGLRSCVMLLAAIAAALTSSKSFAETRHHHRFRALGVRQAAPARAQVQRYTPPGAAIVVDGNSGDVLYATNADSARHPASLTKIMTLYLLFERLEAGKIKLDTPLRVSEHAAEQAPTKLGLKAGRMIAVEDAIKGVVTKSANDAAVAIAENLGGDEDAFAKLMTQKAHALGMSHTTYVNASGLPDDDQITTARDQALLGREIQERFPQYYKYFSLPAFVYHGVAMRNHDHLLGLYGVDGIKTGYTRDSGFNLVTSVHRDGRYIVAVVLGGRSASERDARMRELINAHIKEASLRRNAPIVAEKTEPSHDALAFAGAPVSSPAVPPPTATAVAHSRVTVGSTEPIQPVTVKTIPYRAAPAQTTALAPLPNLVPAATAAPQTVEAVRMPPAKGPTIVVAATVPAAVASSAASKPAKIGAAPVEPAETVLAPAAPQPQARPRGGWLIQIGAFDGEDEAKQHLSAAQLKAPTVLAAADPFTERVQKGDKALYRARFAGFDKAAAEAACRQLKRSNIACMTLKN